MKLKIFHLAFAKNGGAGNVANIVSKAMRVAKYDSIFLYRMEAKNLIGVLKNSYILFFSVIDNYIIKKKRKLPFFSILRSFIHIRRVQSNITSNSIIHLHWIPGLLNLKKLQKLPQKNIKIVITLHDMWFFTGGCHFSNGCTQYVSGCKRCPMVHTFFRPLVARQHKKKKQFFSNHANALITAPSQNLLHKSLTSEILKNHDHALIPNPISDDVKFNGSKISARELTNIEEKYFVVGFVATDINDPRKNFNEALLAVKNLVSVHPEAQIKFVVIGGGFNQDLEYLPFIHRIGNLKDPALLGAYYATFDVLLLTSTEENLPLVLIEAIVNNTYVIASNSGGSLDLITSNQIGLIYKNLNDLSTKLIDIFNSKIYEGIIFENKKDYSSSHIALQYLKAYENLK